MNAVLRTATAAEVALMLEWAKDEGWNPGLEDAAAFRAADPDGFFVAELDGAPVAAISVVNHSGSFAFLGLYLCRPEYRGQGFGLALWTHALAHAGDRTVGLDGVAAQKDNYARSGFVQAGATRRFEGALKTETAPDVRAARLADLGALAEMDRAACGFARPAFLSAWLTPTETRRTLVLDQAGPAGFATIRACESGAKIGPIVADTADDALHLARAAAAELGEAHAIIDVPAANTALITALTQEGFEETFATTRMYRGPAPATGPALQAIATMELG